MTSRMVHKKINTKRRTIYLRIGRILVEGGEIGAGAATAPLKRRIRELMIEERERD